MIITEISKLQTICESVSSVEEGQMYIDKDKLGERYKEGV